MRLRVSSRLQLRVRDYLEAYPGDRAKIHVTATFVAGAGGDAEALPGDATGPHLHFEVRRYGTPIDPAPFHPSRLEGLRFRRCRVRLPQPAASAAK